jgi:hypothetical protein
MEIAQKVIDVAFAMDMWIFGGYVRDVIVRGEQKFRDLDICCEKEKFCANQFIRTLACFFNVSFHQVNERSSYSNHKVHTLLIRDQTKKQSVRIDIVVYEGTFREWCKDTTVDFSCNLFYSTHDTYIGLRYVPKFLQYTANPMKILLDMTRRKEYIRVWDVKISNECQAGHVLKIHSRAKDLIKRGWFLLDIEVFMSNLMYFELMNHPVTASLCESTFKYMKQLQMSRIIRELPQTEFTKKIEFYLLDTPKTEDSQHVQESS